MNKLEQFLNTHLSSKDNLQDVLLKFYLNLNKSSFSLLHWISKTPSVLHIIDEYSKQLNIELIDSTLPKRVWHFINKQSNYIKCLECGKDITDFKIFSNPYNTFCSKSCTTINLHKNKKFNYNKTIETKKKKSEDPNYQKNIEFKKKQTLLKNTGYDHPMKVPEYIKKYKENNIAKYGVDNPAKSDIVKKKLKKAWDVHSNKERIEKSNINRIKYFLENYNVKSSLDLESTRIKIQNTNLKRYGHISPLGNSEIYKKATQAQKLIKEYTLPSGKIIKYQGYVGFAIDELLKTYSEDQFEVDFNINPVILENDNGKQFKYRPDIYIQSENKYIEVKSLYSLSGYYDGTHEKTMMKLFKLINKGYDVELWIYVKSKFYKINLLNLKSIDNYTIMMCNTHIIAPFCIAEIYNINESVNAHEFLNNQDLFYNEGFRLILLYSDELINKFDIVNSRINNIIQIDSIKRIYARKCNIIEITGKQSREFLNANHYKGFTPAQYKYGLVYENELVAVMTFGMQRVSLGSNFDKDNYELIRYSTKLGINVIGGASKLFKYFIKTINPLRVFSYADRAWSNKKSVMYDKIGMKYVGNTIFNYWWVKDDIRYNRYNFTKKKLISEGFSKNKTEKEIMLERGYNQIFDVGNLKYEWTNT